MKNCSPLFLWKNLEPLMTMGSMAAVAELAKRATAAATVGIMEDFMVEGGSYGIMRLGKSWKNNRT